MNRKARWKPSQVENTVVVVKEIDAVFHSVVSALQSVPMWCMKENIMEGEYADCTAVSQLSRFSKSKPFICITIFSYLLLQVSSFLCLWICFQKYMQIYHWNYSILLFFLIHIIVGLPWWLSNKEPASSAGEAIWPLYWEDALEEGMAIHSSILVGKIAWTEEPRVTIGSQRVGHDWSRWTHTHPSK